MTNYHSKGQQMSLHVDLGTCFLNRQPHKILAWLSANSSLKLAPDCSANSFPN